MIVVACFVVLSGWFVYLVFGPEKTTLSQLGEGGGSEPPISYEETSVLADPAINKPQRGKGPQAPAVVEKESDAKRPLVAIVIDDMGHNEKICEALIDLDLDLSFAFLPFGPHTTKQAARASRQGHDVLLHFPMEAADPKWKPGAGNVTIAMAPADIRRIFAANLASVPSAIGINNHMGSRFTQNDRAMRYFMASVRGSGLFFLDSRTSRNSVGFSLAQEMAVKTAKRDVFLDNVRDPKKIIIQLHELLDVAKRHGFAVAIGHPYPETLQALREYKGELLRRAEVVGVGALVR